VAPATAQTWRQCVSVRMGRGPRGLLTLPRGHALHRVEARLLGLAPRLLRATRCRTWRWWWTPPQRWSPSSQPRTGTRPAPRKGRGGGYSLPPPPPPTHTHTHQHHHNTAHTPHPLPPPSRSHLGVGDDTVRRVGMGGGGGRVILQQARRATGVQERACVYVCVCVCVCVCVGGGGGGGGATARPGP
jgi:hypothetical protein